MQPRGGVQQHTVRWFGTVWDGRWVVLQVGTEWKRNDVMRSRCTRDSLLSESDFRRVLDQFTCFDLRRLQAKQAIAIATWCELKIQCALGSPECKTWKALGCDLAQNKMWEHREHSAGVFRVCCATRIHIHVHVQRIELETRNYTCEDKKLHLNYILISKACSLMTINEVLELLRIMTRTQRDSGWLSWSLMWNLMTLCFSWWRFSRKSDTYCA